jgi:hypothetical protein
MNQSVDKYTNRTTHWWKYFGWCTYRLSRNRWCRTWALTTGAYRRPVEGGVELPWI